ncbi:MAG: LlaJI family restriction endonuclease, partial [Firmicutes bacterium]|nr:LlaJI family restriction endonuclease [Bacillota bacterium]
MVDAMFSKVDDIRQFYPTATWDLVLETKTLDSSNLRPDTVLIKDNKVYILDAKYYRYGTTFKPTDMPETTSIQKQITYGEYVKKVKQGQYDDVFSAFVLPYSKYDNEHIDRFNHILEFVGIARAKWIDSETESSRRIAAILVDTTFLINNWVKKNEDNIDGIINLIESSV